MLTITATELKLKLGQMMDQARREPVIVQSHGRDSIVMLDMEEYRRLIQNAHDDEGIGGRKAEESMEVPLPEFDIQQVDCLSEEAFLQLRQAITAREMNMKPSAIRRLPLEERRRILRTCAEDAAKYYDPKEWEEWQGGDFLEDY